MFSRLSKYLALLILATPLLHAQTSGQFSGGASSSGGAGTVSNCAAAGNAFYSAAGTTVSCDQIITDNGSGVLTFGTNGQLVLQAGSATVAPALYGSGATVWFYNCTTAQLCVSQGTANPMITILSGKMQMGNAQAFGWASTAASNGSVDLTICRQATGVLEVGSGAACGTSGTLMATSYDITTKVWVSGTAPTISSGFGTTPSVVANNGTGAFTINVGTGGVATSGVIGLPTATTGWNVECKDLTTTSATVFVTKQTASTTTTATVGNFNTSGVAAAWAASDVLSCSAQAY